MPRTALLASLLLASVTAAARADMIAPPPPLLRLAHAQTVVIGTVESVEEKSVTARRHPNDPENGEYRVAVVKVETAIAGAKGLTHVRVGYLPLPDANAPRRRPG